MFILLVGKEYTKNIFVGTNMVIGNKIVMNEVKKDIAKVQMIFVLENKNNALVFRALFAVTSTGFKPVTF